MRLKPTGATPPQVGSTTSIQAEQAKAVATRERAIQAAMGKAPEPMNTPETSVMNIPKPNPVAEAASVETAEVAAAPVTTAPKAPETQTSDPKLSARVANLVKRERALMAKQRQMQQTLQAKERELAAKEESLKTQQSVDLSKYIEKERLKSNPLGALEDAQLTYDELTQQYIAAQNRNPVYDNTINKLMSEINSLKSQIEEGKQQAIEQQNQSYKAAVAQIKADVTQLVNRNPAFETVKATRSIGDVVELIERVYKEEGRVMDIEEAATEVENYLVDEALKLTKIGKIKSKLAPKVAPSVSSTSTQSQTDQATKQPQPMKTLTNQNSAISRQLTRVERAILAAKGELR